MARETSSEIEVVVPQTRGDNAVHPLEANRTAPPPPEQPQLRAFRRWVPWLVPVFVVANVVMFLVTMYVNNCLKNSPRPCVAPFLGRFAFNPLRENPLVGPSSSAFIVGLIMLFRGVNANDHCSWCHYLSCVPTSKWSCRSSVICFVRCLNFSHLLGDIVD
ncbi:hypothetical protein COCNU_04G001740 [Cocos nucifera]|uniref:Rhomboid-like protein n=1 Tax=Cocos nucifera TaxID=13894 RepID=A0A8K0I4L3_COCNU|nr:hypothetical protein COCNU_04G001740 [Cocos nucifera]